NKGEIMGCSNPHPHGQIWAQSTIPGEPAKESLQFKQYFDKKGKSILTDYIELEQKKQERIVCENEHFIALVPFWAVWPFETLVVSKRHVKNVLEFTDDETQAFAEILKKLTIKYDN